jgi:hypothetical protein
LTTGIALARKEQSYFNRTTFHFCSHQHTPNACLDDGPGFIKSAHGIYIPWKIFTDFAKLGSLPQREIIIYALKDLLGDQITLETNLPSQGIVTLMSQNTENRFILHLLYASPVLRGFSDFTQKNVEVIEDLIPIHGTELKIRVNRPITRIYLAPQMSEIDFVAEKDFVSCTIQEFTCHQMVVLEY